MAMTAAKDASKMVGTMPSVDTENRHNDTNGSIAGRSLVRGVVFSDNNINPNHPTNTTGLTAKAYKKRRQRKKKKKLPKTSIVATSSLVISNETVSVPSGQHNCSVTSKNATLQFDEENSHTQSAKIGSSTEVSQLSIGSVCQLNPNKKKTNNNKIGTEAVHINESIQCENVNKGYDDSSSPSLIGIGDDEGQEHLIFQANDAADSYEFLNSKTDDDDSVDNNPRIKKVPMTTQAAMKAVDSPTIAIRMTNDPTFHAALLDDDDDDDSVVEDDSSSLGNISTTVDPTTNGNNAANAFHDDNFNDTVSDVTSQNAASEQNVEAENIHTESLRGNHASANENDFVSAPEDTVKVGSLGLTLTKMACPFNPFSDVVDKGRDGLVNVDTLPILSSPKLQEMQNFSMIVSPSHSNNDWDLGLNTSEMTTALDQLSPTSNRCSELDWDPNINEAVSPSDWDHEINEAASPSTAFTKSSKFRVDWDECLNTPSSPSIDCTPIGCEIITSTTIAGGGWHSVQQLSNPVEEDWDHHVPKHSSSPNSYCSNSRINTIVWYDDAIVSYKAGHIAVDKADYITAIDAFVNAAKSFRDAVSVWDETSTTNEPMISRAKNGLTESLAMIAQCYLYQKNWDLTTEYAAMVLEHDPSNEPVRLNLVQALFELKNYIAVIEHAVYLPDNEQAQFLVSQSLHVVDNLVNNHP